MKTVAAMFRLIFYSIHGFLKYWRQFFLQKATKSLRTLMIHLTTLGSFCSCNFRSVPVFHQTKTVFFFAPIRQNILFWYIFVSTVKQCSVFGCFVRRLCLTPLNSMDIFKKVLGNSIYVLAYRTPHN